MNLKHHFLLAMPSLDDETFGQSLVYLADHGRDGAVGVVVNRPSTLSLGQVFEELGIDCDNATTTLRQTYTGGPVAQQHGLILHDAIGRFESTVSVNDHVALSSSSDVLEAIADGQAPSNFRVFFGHAGWSPGQLEQEIADNAWLTCEADLDVLFRIDPALQREAASRLMGFDLHQMSSACGHA